MSKLMKFFLASVAFSLFIIQPAFSERNAGCKNFEFIGTYTHLDSYPDVWGDGSNVLNQTIRQLTLHGDGTAVEETTAAPDVMISEGTTSSRIGTWKCRRDGQLVVTLIYGAYAPTTDAVNHPSSIPNPPPVDIILLQHSRVTYLFSVTDANTLTRTQARTRRYDPTQDPTDPAGGTLEPLATNHVVYNRLVASDADLLAP
jgi:hypothetical protein